MSDDDQPDSRQRLAARSYQWLVERAQRQRDNPCQERLPGLVSQSESDSAGDHHGALGDIGRNLTEGRGTTRKGFEESRSETAFSQPEEEPQTGPRQSETEPEMLTAPYPRPTLPAVYLSTPQVAELLNVTPRTVRHWVRNENFPLMKVGRIVRHDWRDVQDWMAAHRGKSPDQEGARDGGKRQRRVRPPTPPDQRA